MHGLARAQVAAGDRVEVFTTDADGPLRLDVPRDRSVDRDGVSVRYFRLGVPARLYRSPALARALHRRAGEFDVVHAHSVFLCPTLVAARAARNAGVPYLVSPRGMLVAELIRAHGSVRKRGWIALFERRNLRRAAAIHVTSASEAEEIRRLGLDLAPFAEVANGVALEGDDEPAGPGDADRVAAAVAAGPYVLMLGRIAAKKRIEIAIDALTIHPTIRLVVAGNDDEGRAAGLVERARGKGVAGRVTFLGEVRGAPKRELLARAVALALPSISENLGNVVLESLAAGRPVVVSAEVGAAAIVERSRAGLVVAADAGALGRALGELLADPARATEMGARGRAFVRDELSWERIAALMCTAYETAIARARPERS